VLLAPNAFSTPIFRRAFELEGQILESGYPRNDLLHQANRAQRAAAVRERLGLSADQRVLLYAPTWRDDAFQQNGRYRFELKLDLQRVTAALGDDHILLLRLHTNVRNSQQARMAGAGVIDVTRYPDIADLYLISDVLITDYSSAMFDFAGTGRPMLFFTYDLERYRDELRGFYFDFEAEAPGPLLNTSDELIQALRDVDRSAGSYEELYKAFRAKFCALDDGSAAVRVVDRILAWA
jgi:CDP-glycerol glycerophosphotransferase